MKHLVKDTFAVFFCVRKYKIYGDFVKNKLWRSTTVKFFWYNKKVWKGLYLKLLKTRKALQYQKYNHVLFERNCYGFKNMLGKFVEK